MSNIKNKQGSSKKKTIIIVSSVFVVLIGLGAGLGVAFGGTNPDVAQTGNGDTSASEKEKPVGIDPKDYWEKITKTDLNFTNKQFDILKIKKVVKTEKQLVDAYKNIASVSEDISSINELHLPYHLKGIVNEEKVKEILNIKDFDNSNIGYILHEEDYKESIAKSSTNLTGGYKQQKLVELNLPEDIETLANNIFSENKIKKVNWSELTKLKSIGKAAFYDNELTRNLDLSGLTSLTLIGEFAFVTNNLNGTLILPPKLETIGKRAFNSLNFRENTIKGTLKLPKTLKTIGEEAFIANEIEVLDWSEAESLVEIQGNAFTFNKIRKLQFSATTPPKLKTIGIGAFSSNRGISNNGELLTKDVVLPDTLETIGEKAIKVTNNIKVSVGPNGGTGIGSHSFIGSVNITKRTK